MKSLLTIGFIILTAAVLTAPAFAGAPINGAYQSQNGDVLHGRFSESFLGGGFLMANNVQTNESYDAGGDVLKTQWYFSCPTLVSVVLESDDTDVQGTGFKKYTKTFVGGSFWLNGTGEAWDGGDASYSGTIDTYVENVTVQFVFNQRITSNSNFEGQGTFANYSNTCLVFTANGVEVLSPSGSYPGYVDGSCTVVGGNGRLGNSTDWTFTIGPCAVPTEETTWGAIKSIYEQE